MSDFVKALTDVPAGVWTVLVAVFGFGFTGWSNREAAKERKDIRTHQDSKDSVSIQHENAQNWREIRLDAINRVIDAFAEFMAAFEQTVPDHKDDALEEKLQSALLTCRQAGLAIQVRSTANVVKAERELIRYLTRVVFDANRWKDLSNQSDYPAYSPFNSFTATHHYHDTLFIAANNLNQFIEACRQELGIIEYRLPELKDWDTGPTYGTGADIDAGPSGGAPNQIGQGEPPTR